MGALRRLAQNLGLVYRDDGTRRPPGLKRPALAASACLCATLGLLLLQAATPAAAFSQAGARFSQPGARPSAGLAKAAKVDLLAAISCPSGQMCVAVGTAGNGSEMLAESWNGHS